MVVHDAIIMAKQTSKKKKEDVPEQEKAPVYVYAQVYHMDENYSHSGGKHALTGSVPMQGGKKYRIELRGSKSGKLHSGVKVALVGKHWIHVN